MNYCSLYDPALGGVCGDTSYLFIYLLIELLSPTLFTPYEWGGSVMAAFVHKENNPGGPQRGLRGLMK